MQPEAVYGPASFGTLARRGACRPAFPSSVPIAGYSDSNRSRVGRRRRAAIRQTISISHTACSYCPTYPLHEAQRHQFGGRDAVLQVLQERLAVERVQLVQIAKQNVRLALQPSGHQRSHLFGQQLVAVALQRKTKKKTNSIFNKHAFSLAFLIAFTIIVGFSINIFLPSLKFFLL